MVTSLILPLHRVARQSPDAPALSFADRTHSVSEMCALVARMAGELRQRGVGDGDRVALLGTNDDTYLLSILAIIWAGAVAVPLNTRWTDREIGDALSDCSPRLLLTGRDPREATRAICSLDISALCATSALPVEDLGRSNHDLAFLVYTGGTTGRSKGVMISHAGLYTSAVSYAAFDGGIGDTVLQFAPMFHIAGINVAWAALLRGSHQIFLPGFDPAEVLRTIETRRVTDMFTVPTMLQAIVDHPDFARHDLRSLRRIAYGASSISDALLDRALACLPETGFVQAYGMTELSPVATLLSAEDHRDPRRRRSAGRATLMTDVRIVGPDDRELPAGEIGEIAVRGGNMMLGYWGMEEASRAAMRGGWMHTGDLGHMDADGYVFVVDRLKDMIISGGENIYSAEVERALLTHPLVAQCAVIGIPHLQWGESVHAVIVPNSTTTTTLEDIQHHCRAVLAGYKIPRSVEFREVLPLSAAGKVLKTVLRAQWTGDDAASCPARAPQPVDGDDPAPCPVTMPPENHSNISHRTR